MKNKRFVRIVVRTMDELEAVVSKINGSDWIFRGQSNAKWLLQPTLERLKRECSKEIFRNYRGNTGILKIDLINFLKMEVMTNEYDVLERGKEWSQRVDGEDNIHYAARMQHAEYPTRLLDFSESIYFALHFGLCGPDAIERMSVWCVRTTPMINRLKKSFPIKWESSIGDVKMFLQGVASEVFVADKKTSIDNFVMPIWVDPDNNERLAAQAGLFLLPFRVGNFHYDFLEMLSCASVQSNEILSDGLDFDIEGCNIIKIEIEPHLRECINDCLKQRGVDRASLMVNMRNFPKCPVYEFGLPEK